jgi:amino acid adenylation domain-containing protein
MLVLQNYEQTELELPGLTLMPMKDEGSSAKFDLTLTVREVKDELRLSWNYNSDIFAHSTINQLTGHFNRLISEALQTPTQSIGRLALLSEEEQQQLLQHSLGSVFIVPEQPVQYRFEQYAQQQPTQIALVGQNSSYTYQQLDQHANGLAQLLRDEYQCQSGQLVAFCLQRGIQQIVTMLAVLKAGCCYVPLDSSLPDERLQQIVLSYPDLLLLTDQQNTERFSGSAVRLLSDIPTIMAEQPPELSDWQPELPVYVLHTSGSTGKPKAVEMSHGALASFLAGIEQHQPLLQGYKRMLQFASIGFDMSFTDIFLALGHGGCLTLMSAEQQYNPQYLVNQINEAKLTVLNLPYAMLVALAACCVDGNMQLPSVKCIVSTAEQLKITPVLVAFFESNPQITLVNHYGPTETHVVTAKTLSGAPSSWAALPDIGRPISNVQTLVLDKAMQLVPRGVAGELYLGGGSLATGYLGEKGLTQERFIANPYSGKLPGCGRLLYKTGDLVRWREDGTLEYLGRNDFQVKIRGFRIELGDIEAALRQSGAAECLALAIPDVRGDLQLIAYFRSDVHLDVVHLQQHVAKLLPAYMMPTQLIAVDKFALNANGKIDRKALPAPDASQMQAEYVAPQTDTEQKLAVIWQQLLGVERVGRHDNFFTLGGHSLLATRLATCVRQQLSVDLPLNVLFSEPQLNVISVYLDSLLLSTVEEYQLKDDAGKECFL